MTAAQARERTIRARDTMYNVTAVFDRIEAAAGSGQCDITMDKPTSSGWHQERLEKLGYCVSIVDGTMHISWGPVLP